MQFSKCHSLFLGSLFNEQLIESINPNGICHQQLLEFDQFSFIELLYHIEPYATSCGISAGRALVIIFAAADLANDTSVFEIMDGYFLLEFSVTTTFCSGDQRHNFQLSRNRTAKDE